MYFLKIFLNFKRVRLRLLSVYMFVIIFCTTIILLRKITTTSELCLKKQKTGSLG